jgi:hypothetical protein
MSATTATDPHYQTSKSAVFAYYRGWKLPWELAAEQEEKFVKILQWVGLGVLLLTLLVPYLPLPEPDPDEEVIPERRRRVCDIRRIPQISRDIAVKSEVFRLHRILGSG